MPTATYFSFILKYVGAVGNARQGIKDVVVSALPQFVNLLVGFAGSVIVARGLGSEILGRYTLILSLAGVATVVSDLGIGQTAIRFASRAAAFGDTPAQMAILRWALRCRFGLILLVTFLFFLISPSLARIWHDEGLSPYLRFGLLGGVFSALSSIPSVYFLSIKKFGINAAVDSAQKAIAFAGIAALAASSLLSLRNLMIITLTAAALGSFIFLILVPKAAMWPDHAIQKLRHITWGKFISSPAHNTKTSTELDVSSPVEFLRFHMLATVITIITTQVSTWMMGYFLNDKSQIGLFAVASRFTLPMIVVTSSVSTALWPRASGVRERSQVAGMLKRTMVLSIAVTSLMLIYSWSGPLLAPLLFGPAYQDATFLGQILCLRYCFAMLICPVTILGYCVGLVRVVWILNLVQLISLVVINYLLLPKIGPMASAVALLVHELFGSLVVAYLVFLRLERPIKTDSTVEGTR